MAGMKFISLKKNIFLPLFCFCFSVFHLEAKIGSVPVQGESSASPAVLPAAVSAKKKAGDRTSGKVKLQIQIPPEQQKFFRELSIILDSIRKTSPHTGKVVDELLKKDSFAVIRDFLQGSKAGIVCITVEEGEKKVVLRPRGKSSGNGKNFYREDLSDGKLRYIFLPDLSDGSIQKCVTALDGHSSCEGGIVLDLRKCDDYNPVHLDLAVRLFRELALKGKKHGRPSLAVITGSGTKGNGEILAWTLKQESGVISVGSMTGRQPFVLRPLPLKITHTVSGGTKEKVKKKFMRILVPVIPDKWKEVSLTGIIPQIRTGTVPLYRDGADSPEKDPALRIASDLLLSLMATGTKIQ
ncbi:MAG: hypothetical protein IKA79_03095 [Lentisphaeria bacterium]|nr:hypothetical protein [Lentisphaeria bacterium]